MKHIAFLLIVLVTIVNAKAEDQSKVRITNRELQKSELCSLYAHYKDQSSYSEDVPNLECNNGTFILPMNEVIMGGNQEEILEEVGKIMTGAGLNYLGKLPLKTTQDDLKIIQHLFKR